MYQPILRNGQKAELPWQLIFIKFNLCWPLSENVSGITHFFHDAWTMMVTTFFLETIHADWLFIFAYIDDLELITESLCTTFIGMMMFCRILHLQFNRRRLREVFYEFFDRIYISREENEEIFLLIKKALRPMNFLTVACIAPLIIFLLTPIITVALNYTETGKPFPYKLVFPYDAQKPVAYVITVMYTSWVGIAVTTVIPGEHTLVSMIFNHLTNRMKLLHKDIQAIYVISKEESKLFRRREEGLHIQFNRLLREAIRKQNEAIQFADDLEKLFNPMSFIVFVFSTVLLCVVAFQLAARGVNLTTSRYIFWLCACLFEVHILSNIGQKLIDASQQMANEFYMCNWEHVIQYGSQQDNIQLIRSLQFAIARSQKPVCITVLKFTKISLVTFLRVLNTALSYFMFLNTMQDVNKKN